jgi:hypothetical protein
MGLGPRAHCVGLTQRARLPAVSCWAPDNGPLRQREIAYEGRSGILGSTPQPGTILAAGTGRLSGVRPGRRAAAGAGARRLIHGRSRPPPGAPVPVCSRPRREGSGPSRADLRPPLPLPTVPRYGSSSGRGAGRGHGGRGNGAEKRASRFLRSERGVPESTVRHLEETVGAERLGVYLEDLLEEGSMRGRLRRAGLRVDFD